MKKLFLAILLLCTLLLCVGCDTTPKVPEEDPPTPIEPLPPAPTYNDPTHQSGAYKVTYIMWIDELVHYYDEGELPDPPEVADIELEVFTMKFVGWKSELLPVTGDVTYVASYEKITKTYDAIFVLGGGKELVVPTRCGRAPTFPTDIPDYDGATFACWDRAGEPASTTNYYYAIYAKTMPTEHMKSLWSYSSWGYALHGYRDMQAVCAMYSLLREIREGADQPVLVDRLVNNVVDYSQSTAPKFDLDCLWDYGITTAFFALAKQTPLVWEKLGTSTVKRIDTIMEAFAYIESIGTSDYNNYSTGPGMTYNYNKGWNPNYRLANVPVMVFVTHYFGNGDMTLGAERVNDFLTSFNETTYTLMLRRFELYGFTNALECWGTPEAKAMLVHGVAPGGRGSGVGVNNGGKDYLYQGTPLSDGAEILRKVVAYNYSGGAVRNDHWYTVNGKYQKVSWILDGTTTPYLGEEGMMLEFASGSRSSTVYCDHDFVMCVLFFDAARSLVLYTDSDAASVPVLTPDDSPAVLWDVTKDTELWHKIQIGTEDFLYKNIHGYMSFYIYASGPSQTPHGESNGGSTGYWSMKHLWRSEFLPLGTVAPAE